MIKKFLAYITNRFFSRKIDDIKISIDENFDFIYKIMNDIKISNDKLISDNQLLLMRKHNEK